MAKVVKNEVEDYLTINVAEDETAWSASSNYNYGDEARDGNFIYTYGGIDGTNTETSPSTDILGVWVQTAPTNYYAMLDGATETQTTNADTIVFEINNARYDTISLLNLDAQSVTIELIDKTTATVYQTETFNLLDRDKRIDAYTHYFLPIGFKNSVYFDGIYLTGNTKIKVTIDNTGNDAKCGRLVAGQSTYLGATLYPVDFDRQSYSRFITDPFANTTLTPIATLPTRGYRIRVATTGLKGLDEILSDFDAIPALYIGDESSTSTLDNLLVFGYYSEAPIVIQNPRFTDLNLKIKGLK